MNTFEKFLIQVIIYILGILIALFLDIYIVYLSRKKNTKMSIYDFCIFNIIFSDLCQLFSYTINFLTISPLDSLSICIIQATLINSFMVITDLFILFLSLSLLTTMICDINCCESKITKFTTTILLYVIPFILFNHIIRGKEGKTGFNGVFCYSSDDSI